METSRYLTCLRHDAARLRELSVGHLDAPVPSCPGWTVRELVDHVAEAYQHKTQCIRLREFPRPWPPEPTGEEPMEHFDRSLAELLAEFDLHDPSDPARTWHEPDQTVGFWIRRMALETVIHRVDGELAVDEVTAIPSDLALDGVDEALALFLSYQSIWDVEHEGPGSWPALGGADGRPVVILARASGSGTTEHVWSVRSGPAGVHVAAGATPDAAATVSGDPVDLLLWLWRRVDGHGLSMDGDPTLVDQLHDLMFTATQ